MASVLPKLIPSVAVMMSNIQMASPLRAVLICRKHNSLGSLNPIPWAVALLNCLGYMIYGCITGDPYVMASVTLGIPINYFAVSSALGILGKSGKVSDNDTSWRLDCIILGGVAMWILIAFTIGMILPLLVSDEEKNTVALSILGYFACATCMFYYFSPLTALKETVRTRDAAGLYTPMIVMNLITSVMWAIYGFVYIGDVVVYGPNMFAVFLSAVQLGIKCHYPSIDASKLQRKLTVVEMRDDFLEGGDEEAKEVFVDGWRPIRGRAGTFTQDIVCGDGTVGVIAFNEGDVVARNHRSNTLTSVTELVLDSIDFIGPRRHPADVVEVHPSPENHFPVHTYAHGSARSPRATRSVSFSSVPTATAVPMVPISPRQRAMGSPGSGSGSGGQLPMGLASPGKGGRRRTQSLTEVLPQIAEEGRAITTADEDPVESYSYGRASSSPGSSSPRTAAGNAPLLATGAPLSTGHNAGAGLLHVLSEAMQGRSRTTSRATSYDPLDEEVHEVPL